VRAKSGLEIVDIGAPMDALWMRLQISRIRLSDKTSRLFACNAVCTQRPLEPYVEERLERMRRLRITARLDATQLSLQHRETARAVPLQRCGEMRGPSGPRQTGQTRL
jgi:hypothetical protein